MTQTETLGASGGRKGRPPGSSRGPGTIRHRGGGRAGGRGQPPKRDWGRDDDEGEDEYERLIREVGAQRKGEVPPQFAHEDKNSLYYG